MSIGKATGAGLLWAFALWLAVAALSFLFAWAWLQTIAP